MLIEQKINKLHKVILFIANMQTNKKKRDRRSVKSKMKE